ncbi:MAG: DNA-directed DNA polymerase [Nanoarchaeota archaeon]|nr:DNA-directed DNA polymerase [Nanoarchaeota archaeon]
MTKKIQAYLLDITYKVLNNKAVIHLYARSTDNKLICIQDPTFEPYFYVIPKSDIKEKLQNFKTKDASITKVEEVKRTYLGEQIKTLKVTASLPSDVPKLREEIRKWDEVESLKEFDIPFKKKYLIDKSIYPLGMIEVTGKEIESSFPTIVATKVIPQDEMMESPNILAFDIETYSPNGKTIDPENNPILMAAFHGKKYKKVLCWKKFPTKHDYIEFVEDEAALIRRCKEIFKEQAPDLIAGYYSDGFDMPYLHTRAQKHKIALDIGLDGSNLKVERRRNTSADICGINHFDVFKFVRKSLGPTLGVFSLKLDTVANKLLGEQKVGVDIALLHEVWDKRPKELEIYAVYNLHDAYLTIKLAEKLWPNLIEMNKIVGMTAPDLARSGFAQLIETYIMREAYQADELAPDVPRQDDYSSRNQDRLIGGYVHEPQPGLYKDVTIFDFRSLYPTIIASHNIDLGSLNKKGCKKKILPPWEKGEKDFFCQDTPGFIPRLIREIIQRRQKVKEAMKQHTSPVLEAKSQSLKLLANSFYGYLGFPNARWYCHECAEATTAYGRYYIKHTIKEAEKHGFKVIYSDTDSIFIALQEKKLSEVKSFQKEINRELPGVMELEYEGHYPAGIFVGTKSGSGGAKKRYALMNDEGELKVRGFESVRRNTSPITKETQEKVLKMILKDHNSKRAEAYLKKVVQKFKDHLIPLEDCIITTQLTREIKSYSAIGPHVAVAMRMQQQGTSVGAGSVIAFVITKNGTKIRDKARIPEEVSQKQYDPEYYINHQILPAVEKIFEVFNIKKDEIATTKKQSTLGSFL